MAMTTTLNAPEREEIEQLLPWHAAGTLSRRDAQRVEQALQSDPELARQYALVREEFSETIHLNETLGAPSSRACRCREDPRCRPCLWLVRRREE